MRSGRPANLHPKRAMRVAAAPTDNVRAAIPRALRRDWPGPVFSMVCAGYPRTVCGGKAVSWSRPASRPPRRWSWIICRDKVAQLWRRPGHSLPSLTTRHAIQPGEPRRRLPENRQTERAPMTDGPTDFTFVSSIPSLEFYSATKLLHTMAHAFDGLHLPIAMINREGIVHHVNRRMLVCISSEKQLFVNEKRLQFTDKITGENFYNAVECIFESPAEVGAPQKVKIPQVGDAEELLAIIQRIQGDIAVPGFSTDSGLMVALVRPPSEECIESAILRNCSPGWHF